MKTRWNLLNRPRGPQVALLLLWLLVSWLADARATAADTFTVATYNLENYLLAPQESRKAKPIEARNRVHEILKILNADVLALQEVGGETALAELRDALKREGLNYPQSELIQGPDPLLNLAILSRFPITARRPHPQVSFLLNGRRFKVSRGFAEVDIRVNAHYTFTLISAHLKSRRPVPQADEGDLREQEGLCLREIIDARLAADPNLNLLVAGDLNDVKNASSTRAVLGLGNTALVDLRPTEPEDSTEEMNSGNGTSRHVTWTYFYAREDTYSRIDFILATRNMARKCYRKETHVVALPFWGEASDHRPVIASFFISNHPKDSAE